MCVYANGVVSKISPGGDAAIIATHIPRLLALARPKPVFYYNYTVGECRDLVFGVSLTDYANSRDLEEGDIPRIIKICIKEIEERGLNAEGIYRVNSNSSIISELDNTDMCLPRISSFLSTGFGSSCCGTRSKCPDGGSEI